MEGVQILSQVDIMTSPSWAFWLMLISGIITIISLIAKSEGVMIFGVVMMVLAFIFSCTIKVPTGEYEYKITIDNTVSFKEFNTKYEIIGQEGLIYKVRERELNE